MIGETISIVLRGLTMASRPFRFVFLREERLSEQPPEWLIQEEGESGGAQP